ncbi:S8 family peptidase [Parahaliea maris]|uniref:S8 family peptidase n=1 Tax=Parahaliea maris TaxID=2716870 RepID=A0A5C8ZVK3_9GAMM|nr:S8 family peptidase [Parahaliea maris]TXS91291.1 S8 family peptidase [Parahaliea maris]
MARVIHCLATVTLTLLSLGRQASAEDELLRVMLQGESSEQLAALVRQRGGIVTHDLHIINAIGAVLTRDQLDGVLLSPLVTRHIDDLALAPAEEEPELCNVGGALELEISSNALRWQLYNKGEADVSLQTLELQWPERLGALQGVYYDGKLLPYTPEVDKASRSLTLEISGSTPLTPGLSSLVALRFDHPADARAPLQQHEISLSARFREGCAAELIPGYATYGTDTYFPSVAGASALHQLGITGQGVTVAVLDSGLWEHASLSHNTLGRYRVTGRYDAIANVTGQEVFDESGHGTHMTSVLANSSPVTHDGKKTRSFMGIAPDVDIVAVRAFNKSGQGDFLDIVRGIQWIVDQREALNIRVMNLSFAARPRWPYWLDPINQAVMRAWHAGIVVVAAAGNEGPEPMSIGSPGNLPYIITVGAVTDSWTPDNRNDDYIPDFSSRGPTPSAHIKPDIVAPGGHIAGLTRPGSTLTLEHPDYILSTGEFVMTGTSQASALVSGIAALLLQLEPDLSPDDIKCKLTSSAEPAINNDGRFSYSPFQQGNGYVNATRAVTLGKRGCGNVGMDITSEIDNAQHYEGPAIVSEEGEASLPGLKELYAGEATEKGMSDNRRWGVKAHIERSGAPLANTSPIDWPGQYEEERAIIERLSQPPPSKK